MTDPKIYVADLAAYNNGILHGCWIDVTLDIEDIKTAISEMLEESPEPNAEEYAIHDYEGFGGYRVNEYEGIASVHEITCFIEEYPDFGAELLNYCCTVEEAQRMAEDSYFGCYESLADYAQMLTEETTTIPDQLAFYIDYEKMGRDMELSGDITTIETAHDQVHIFSSH